MLSAGLLVVVVVLAAALVVLLVRHAALARRLDRAITQLDPDEHRSTNAGLEASVDHLSGAVERSLARAEEASTARHALEGALNAIPQGVVLSDAEGNVRHRNDVAETYSTARHGDALVEAAVGEVLADAVTGLPGRRTLELFGPPRRTLVITAVPLNREGVGPAEAVGHGVDDRDLRHGAIAIIEDVTERRQLEAVRRDFVANISHELKTPIGAIALLAETVLAEDAPEVRDRLAERMLLEADRVGRTIEDLLTLSQIESEQGPERDEIPAHLVLAEAAERIRPAAEHRDITIPVVEPSPRLALLGDRRQLVSALYNLLDNAVKYSDDGSTVEVRAVTNGRTVDLEVEDHGIGIPSADLERIFERFYRVDQARSRQTGGTGLGLAIVRHVATNHEGEIRVESRAGEGSTFTLRPPAAPGPVAVTAAEAS
jgi:two-component system sensor histidine kinase SenX3